MDPEQSQAQRNRKSETRLGYFLYAYYTDRAEVEPNMIRMPLVGAEPGLVSQDHSGHHVHGGRSGSDHKAVVGVEHELGARTLVPRSNAIVGLVQTLPGGDVVAAVETRSVESGHFV